MFRTLLSKLQTSRYITLETTPTHSATLSDMLDEIERLRLDKMIDGFSTTDNPLSKLKYNSLFAAMRLQERFKKPAIATMSMRDRNRIALQSDLLGANDVDVRAILALTGDSAKISDQKGVKGVFESDSTLLLDMISAYNAGSDIEGKRFATAPKPILPYAVINAYARNPKTLQKKMIKKIEHNAIGIITQPIYNIDNAKILLDLLNEANHLAGSCDTTLILGLFPITKLSTARFLDSHVPGISVPSSWIDALESAKDSLECEKIGFDLSAQLLDQMLSLHPKIHIMTANKFELAHKLLDEVSL